MYKFIISYTTYNNLFRLVKFASVIIFITVTEKQKYFIQCYTFHMILKMGRSRTVTSVVTFYTVRRNNVSYGGTDHQSHL